MNRSRLAWVVAGLGIAPASVPQVPAPADEILELEPVLVIGERPGPALWKVTWKDHTLWLLPTLSPLPRGVIWRSSQVEEALLQSREVFFEASLDMRIDNTGKAGAAVDDALLNPDNKWLADVLPPDMYRQFAALNQRYAGNYARLEMLRPFYASLQLRKQALRRMQLDSDGQVHDQVAYLARKYAVPLRLLGREIAPRAATLAANLRRTPLAVDTECARSQLLQLERELRDATLRANAWSTGDIATLREDWATTRQQDALASCRQLFQQLAPANRAVRETRDRGYNSLRQALRRNQSTLALVLLEEVFDPEGVVARFRSAGYQVDEP